MNEYSEFEIQESLRSFERVWQRAAGSASIPGPPPPVREDKGNLSSLLRGEAAAAKMAGDLACRLSGGDRAVMIRHQAAARRRLRRLRGELFLQDGIRNQQTPPAGKKSRLLDDLRDAYRGDLRCAKAYEQAAAEASDPEQKALFLRYAGQRRAEAGEKRSLILNRF